MRKRTVLAALAAAYTFRRYLRPEFPLQGRQAVLCGSGPLIAELAAQLRAQGVRVSFVGSGAAARAGETVAAPAGAPLRELALITGGMDLLILGDTLPGDLADAGEHLRAREGRVVDLVGRDLPRFYPEVPVLRVTVLPEDGALPVAQAAGEIVGAAARGDRLLRVGGDLPPAVNRALNVLSNVR